MEETDTSHEYLSGTLLVAMPGMGDPRFEDSVILISDHDARGAMGFVINKPMREIRFADLVEQLDIDAGLGARDVPVLSGGPVDRNRGFVIHSTEYSIDDDTVQVEDLFSVTTHADILRDLARGTGPADAMLALGYAGWEAGQLEDELLANAWLTTPATEEILFRRPVDERWAAAMALAGVDPALLSGAAGRA